MTLLEFIALNEQDQAKAIWKGEYMFSREDAGVTVMLYKVHTFYVEVYYSEGKGVVGFVPFSSKDRLAQYFNLCRN